MTQINSQFDSALQNANTIKGQTAFAQRAAAVQKASVANPKLREQVGDFVGTIFYGTLLSQLQDSKFKSEYFHGGRGEEIFKGQLYQEYARRIGRSPNDPMSNRIYEAMTRHLRDEAGKTAATHNTNEQKESRAA